MSKKRYTGFIILAVVFLGAIFFWYSFRPSLIKQSCFEEAREKTKEAKGDFIETYNFIYKVCLQKNGL